MPQSSWTAVFLIILLSCVISLVYITYDETYFEPYYQYYVPGGDMAGKLQHAEKIARNATNSFALNPQQLWGEIYARNHAIPRYRPAVSQMPRLHTGHIAGGDVASSNDVMDDIREEEPRLNLISADNTSGITNATQNSSPAIYGKLINGRNHVVVYNRVPKCGSRTFVAVAEIMANRRDYRKPAVIINPQITKTKRRLKMSATDQRFLEAIATRIRSAKPGVVLHGHVHYIDFTEIDERKRPVYINLIRDPIDRLISAYYFVRNGDGKFTNKQRINKNHKDLLKNETINDCVLRGRRECSGPTDLVGYFCGYGTDCLQPTEAGFEKAKENLEKYLVVGVAEEYEDYLRVLEKLLPGYFDGALKEYKDHVQNGIEKKTSARGKIPPEPHVRQKLRTLLEMDYRFYNYTREKFHKLKRELGI